MVARASTPSRFILGLGYVMGLRASMILVRRRRALEPRAGAADLDDRPATCPTPVYPGDGPDREDDRRRRSSAATCASSASARSRRPASSASSSRCASWPARSAIAAQAFRHGETPAGERTDRDMPIMTHPGRRGRQRARRRRLPRQPDGSPAVVHRSASALTLRLLVLLHLGGRQRHRHHGAQSGLGHDDADDHHLVGRAAALRRLGHDRACSSSWRSPGMVCTALSVSGQTITDLKTGYWLGSTPAAQEKVKFLGVIAASIAVGPRRS